MLSNHLQNVEFAFIGFALPAAGRVVDGRFSALEDAEIVKQATTQAACYRSHPSTPDPPVVVGGEDFGGRVAESHGSESGSQITRRVEATTRVAAQCHDEDGGEQADDEGVHTCSWR